LTACPYCGGQNADWAKACAMCGRQLPAVQQAPAQPQYQQPYQQPMYPAGPAPVQPQYQQQPYQQPQYQQAPQPQYQQQPYQQAQYQQPAAQQQVPQPMMQQPGKPKKNMMLIAILAIVAVVIVVVAIVMILGMGGRGGTTVVIQTVDDSSVTSWDWALSLNNTVPVDVKVHNSGTASSTGTIKVKIETNWMTKYTSEATKSVTLVPDQTETVTVYVTVGLIQGSLLTTGTTQTTATIS
jgi:flagellar basal body-associated protein FliL